MDESENQRGEPGGSSVSGITEDDDDRDSAADSDTESPPQDLPSSVLAYEYEQGRRYHGFEAGRYYAPNDDREVWRMNLQHEIWKLTLHGQLYTVPLDRNRLRRALDVGTGNGIWAMEFADAFPECEVIGTELSPIQPTWVPPNCEFFIHDAESDWDFPPMDYIHSRHLTTSIRNWRTYIQRCADNLAPGGWLELHETEVPIRCDDGSVSEDDEAIDWSKKIEGAVDAIGANFRAQRDFPTYLQDAGLINLRREEYKWPIGQWTGDRHLDSIGEMMTVNVLEMMDASKAFFTRGLEWTEVEMEVFLARSRNSFKDQTKHRYFAAFVHYAQKPPSSEGEST